MSEVVYWDVLELDGREYYLGMTEQGLVEVSLGNNEDEYAAFLRGVNKRVPKAAIIHSPERLSESKRQVNEYLNGERKEFDLPLDLRGTEFQKAVWRATTEIPFGKTCSYLDIARAIGNHQASRAVGGALNKNPVPIVVPCHRVIGKNGALVGFGGGLPLKVEMLKLEGVQLQLDK